MLPFSPVIGLTLAAVGVAALSRRLAREGRRVNAMLDAQDLEARQPAADTAREARATLRRDPRTGVYRPE